jgi:hypothetical protein
MEGVLFSSKNDEMAGVASSEPSLMDHDHRSQDEEEIARRADEAEREARGAAAPPADGENRNEFVAPFSSALLSFLAALRADGV